MTRSSTLPVVAIGRNRDGLPTRMSVPGLTKTVPIVLSGRRLGEAAPDGSVTWSAPGSAGSWYEFGVQADTLREAKWARRRLLASVIDGKVVAVPKRRAPRARS